MIARVGWALGALCAVQAVLHFDPPEARTGSVVPQLSRRRTVRW